MPDKVGNLETKKQLTEEEIISLIKQGKRTYIYQCAKDTLLKILLQEGLQCPLNATVDELRKILSEYHQNKDALQSNTEAVGVLKTKTMASNHEIKQFDGENWEVFEQQLECLILLNDVPDKKQVPLLITKLTPRVFETLQLLCDSAKPSTLSFNTLCEKLRRKYTRTQSSLLDRAEFRRRNQSPSESIEDYVFSLRKLARKCRFKDEDDQIKEKLIEGVHSKLIMFELMKQNQEMKLEDMVQLARTVEAAYKHSNGDGDTSNIAYIKPKQKFKQKYSVSKTMNNKNNKNKCFCCGKDNHLKKDCTLNNKYCSECGQLGHIYKMCPRNKFKQTNVLDVTHKDQTEDQGLEEVKTLYEEYETYRFDKVSKIPPYIVELEIGDGQKVPFEVDTGAEVSVMPITYKEQYLKEYSIEECKVTFRNFDQSVSQPLGIIHNIPVKYNNTVKMLSIYISKGSTPCLMGRDWLSQLKMWPPAFKEMALCHSNILVQNVSDAKQLIDKEFAEVFSPGWGDFKGEAISLKLKRDATPKFLPVRRVPYALRDKVKLEIERLQENGRIVPIMQSQWGTPVVPIMKPDGSVRLCGDYKVTLNPSLEIDHYPLPHVEDIFETLKQGEYYCELDLKEAYLQAALTEESQDLTTIVTEFDCLHLQLYRDPKDRFKKGQTKASLSLQQFLGFESGFTLDKESNTIAIICQDVIVVLAFETRERLIAWQVKVGSQLGSSKEWLVLIGGGPRKLPAGPARLHLQGRRFALASGVPPRLIGLWELAHLRRYGVVEGRFCFEGGSHCGKGEGLHVLITDQAQDITDGFDAAAHGNPRGPASRKSGGADRNRPDTRLSDLNADQSIPDTGLYEENFFGEDCEGVSPFWPSDEKRGCNDHDCKGCEESGTRPPWSGADHVTLERCSNCVTKLGAITRSATVALTPGAQFNPAWTMEAVPESSSDNSSNSTEYLTPRAIKKSLEASHNKDWVPQRPPKPARLEEIKAPVRLPAAACSCSSDRNTASNTNNPKVGPYENYDVPKTTHVEVECTNEYYDTPKRLKRALTDDLFQVTKSSAPGNLVLKKNCGCILKFGSKKKPVIVECDENIQPVECPCQKVTNWANNLISLPYCKRNVNYDKVNTEVLTSQKSEEMALYATVDVSRKTNRQSSITEKESVHDCYESSMMNYENLGPKSEIEFEDPYANYENLEFALSLEYYENAKDLLKKAGVTQIELDALSANVDFADVVLPPKPKHCGKCGHSAKHQAMKKNKSDEYLLMEPTKDIKRDLCRTTGPNPGYTPMSPNPNWSQSLRHPLQKLHRVEFEKSLSIPTLNGDTNRTQSLETTSSNNNKETIQKRSSSVDSARLLEDLKEFDSSIGSHATSSSLETLRNLAIENRRSSSPCDNERDCCHHNCCKSSDSENKTSEGSVSKDVPHLRNKHMDNAQIKRSSSVPCKTGGNRDSSSSNDSGVSSCSMKHGPEFNEFEMPLTSGHSRYQYMAQKRMRGNATGCIHLSLPRKSKSSDLLRDTTMQIHKANVPAKSSSAEAEVPVLPPKQFKGVMDTHSTSSGTSDMSDYIETLSLTSSHSSSDNPNLRLARQPTTTLRPRSGKEYHNLDPIITSMYKSGKELSNYTNLP